MTGNNAPPGMDHEQEEALREKTAYLFGLWAAKQLHLTGENAEVYAKEVVESDREEPGIQDVIRKVKADFSATDVEMDKFFIESQYNVYWEQVLTEAGITPE